MTPSNNDIIVMSYRPAASCVRAFLTQKYPIYSGRTKKCSSIFCVCTYVRNTIYEISQFAKNNVIRTA